MSARQLLAPLAAGATAALVAVAVHPSLLPPAALPGVLVLVAVVVGAATGVVWAELAVRRGRRRLPAACTWPLPTRRWPDRRQRHRASST